MCRHFECVFLFRLGSPTNELRTEERGSSGGGEWGGRRDRSVPRSLGGSSCWELRTAGRTSVEHVPWVVTLCRCAQGALVENGVKLHGGDASRSPRTACACVVRVVGAVEDKEGVLCFVHLKGSFLRIPVAVQACGLFWKFRLKFNYMQSQWAEYSQVEQRCDNS